jgi:WD40 repeat protein
MQADNPNGPYVSALAFGPDGSLFAGGNFMRVDGRVTGPIARWDGAQWQPVGSWTQDYSAEVSALVIGPDGSLYAGGLFATAGGVAANGIARWDGAGWHPLDRGFSCCHVSALAFGLDGSLYAGGHLQTAGGVAVNGVARWDGAQWHPVGGGVNHSVGALTIGPDGSLYAGGYFTTAGGIAANNIARWDGAQWHSLVSGLTGGGNPKVLDLAFTPDGWLYAGGYFTAAGGATANYIARWNGSQWYPLGSGIEGDSGTGVSVLTLGPDGSLYVGGRFDRVGGIAANNVAHWDGLEWRNVVSGNGMNPISHVRALTFGTDSSLYAGGDFTAAGEVLANRIAHWNGSQWHPLGSGIGGGDYSSVHAIAVGPDRSIYAGGNFTTAGEITTYNIARWDGATSSWHPLGSGIGEYDDDVSALTCGPDGSLYAGGDFETAGDIAANDIARWDGAEWHPLGSGMGGVYSYQSVRALAVGPDGSLYAGGDFTTAGGIAANNIARWDGTLWHSLGSGMGGLERYVAALAVGPDGSLYAGGWFTTAGGVAAINVARWDGAQWHPLGNGMNAPVYALAVGPDGSLYAGGEFTTAGGVAVNSIARWDGSQWHPLGSGIPNNWSWSHALAFDSDGSLFVGGTFARAGDKLSSNIAQWTEEVPRPVAWFPVAFVDQ